LETFSSAWAKVLAAFRRLFSRFAYSFSPHSQFLRVPLPPFCGENGSRELSFYIFLPCIPEKNALFFFGILGRQCNVPIPFFWEGAGSFPFGFVIPWR